MNLTQITEDMGNIADTLAEPVPKLLSNPDLVNDPQKMLQLSFSINQFSSYINLESGMIKTVKDLISTISNRTS
uniref:EscF n=1 Tax=Citrobacter rodentium TaxID=67825 RepID=Q93FJ3_CITRO|nr:EscF [Citrobacter rodentium]